MQLHGETNTLVAVSMLFLSCFVFVAAGSPNKTIHLEFEKMSTECSFDFLFIYDGNSYRSPLIATLSGDSLPFPVVARSGYVSTWKSLVKHLFFLLSAQK